MPRPTVAPHTFNQACLCLGQRPYQDEKKLVYVWLQYAGLGMVAARHTAKQQQQGHSALGQPCTVWQGQFSQSRHPTGLNDTHSTPFYKLSQCVSTQGFVGLLNHPTRGLAGQLLCEALIRLGPFFQTNSSSFSPEAPQSEPNEQAQVYAWSLKQLSLLNHAEPPNELPNEPHPSTWLLQTLYPLLQWAGVWLPIESLPWAGENTATNPPEGYQGVLYLNLTQLTLSPTLHEAEALPISHGTLRALQSLVCPHTLEQAPAYYSLKALRLILYLVKYYHQCQLIKPSSLELLATFETL
ncbi:MAG: hypothetical protein ACKO34_00390 [Vampirovibrionales bacterium]